MYNPRGGLIEITYLSHRLVALVEIKASWFTFPQVGIQFVQVGDDPRATEALRELDDDIAKDHGVRVRLSALFKDS